MSNDLNSCSFIGRLGKDPDSRFMPNGDAVSTFSIAVGWKSKDKEGAEWVNITAFGKLAEICNQYLTKGSQAYIQGRMKTDKYTDKDGIDRYSTKIIAEKMQMLGVKSESREELKQEEKPVAKAGSFADMDSDIPFMRIGRVASMVA